MLWLAFVFLGCTCLPSALACRKGGEGGGGPCSNIWLVYVNSLLESVAVSLQVTNLPTGGADHTLLTAIALVAHQCHLHILNAFIGIGYPLPNVLKCFLK